MSPRPGGRPAYWLLWAAAIPLLALMGEAKLHVREFNAFAFALLGIAAAAVAVIAATYRPGLRVTREPFEDGGGEAGGTEGPDAGRLRD